MVIYADVLVVVNLVINYFILLSISKIAKTPLKLGRLLLGSAVGGFLSLYILFPSPPVLIDALLRPVFAAVIVFSAFGAKRKRVFLRHSALFLGATFLFGGAMMAIFAIFKPRGMAIEGGIVYFDIDPTILVASTAVCYLIIRLVQGFSHRRHPMAQRVEIKIYMNGIQGQGTALIDTGHSLSDPFSSCPVVVISAAMANCLLPKGIESAKEMGRYRLIPCRTADGQSMLEGFRPDKAEIGGKIAEPTPIAAISHTLGAEDYDAIISPEQLT